MKKGKVVHAEGVVISNDFHVRKTTAFNRQFKRNSIENDVPIGTKQAEETRKGR